MVKRTLENPYKGINAHLHSLAQNPQDNKPSIWTGLHFNHIGHIVNTLNQTMQWNYVARIEQSLQVWTERKNIEGSEETREVQGNKQGIGIHRTSVTDTTIDVEGENAPVLVIPINPFLEEEITIPSAVIYEVRDHEIDGKPVTRIELLSASNKRGGTGEDGYRKNRLEAIRSGTSLIELDYLHQTASPLSRIARYPDSADSHPYYIALTDCREGFPEEVCVYIRDVNDPLPSKVAIPLAGEDSLVFDFEAVYQHTFRIGRWGIHIDYDELPRNFDSYSAIDKETVREIMEAVKGNY